MSAGGGQFVRLMIAPGGANRSRPSSQRHADIKAGVADDDAGAAPAMAARAIAGCGLLG